MLSSLREELYPSGQPMSPSCKASSDHQPPHMHITCRPAAAMPGQALGSSRAGRPPPPPDRREVLSKTLAVLGAALFTNTGPVWSMADRQGGTPTNPPKVRLHVMSPQA